MNTCPSRVNKDEDGDTGIGSLEHRFILRLLDGWEMRLLLYTERPVNSRRMADFDSDVVLRMESPN